MERGPNSENPLDEAYGMSCRCLVMKRCKKNEGRRCARCEGRCGLISDQRPRHDPMLEWQSLQVWHWLAASERLARSLSFAVGSEEKGNFAHLNFQCVFV